MDMQERLDKIMSATGCSIDVARYADRISNRNPAKAIEVVRSGMNSKPSTKHIIEYKNGMLVDDKFYDYEVEQNYRLKELLRRGEFDRSIIGDVGSHAEVMYTDKSGEFYKVKKDNCSYASGTPRSICDEPQVIANVPTVMKMDEDGSKFKIMISNKIVTVVANKDRKISEFLQYLKTFDSRDIDILKSGTVVDPNACISEIANNLVIATFI